MASSIPLIPVSPPSSLARSLGYDGQTHTLAVEHHDNTVYHYDGVSPAKWDALRNAASVGSYLHKHIRGKHTHTQVK